MMKDIRLSFKSSILLSPPLPALLEGPSNIFSKQKWNASFEDAACKARLLTFHLIPGLPLLPGRMREGFIETFRVISERADTNASPRHHPSSSLLHDQTLHRLCFTTCITIAPTVRWKKLVPLSAGSAWPLWRGGCWFGETVDGVFFCFLAVFINSMGPCKNSGSFSQRVANCNNSKRAAEFNLTLFFPLISCKIAIIGKAFGLAFSNTKSTDIS